MTDHGVTWLNQGGGMTTEQACVMNAVHAVMQLRRIGNIEKALHDKPPCTDSLITTAAIYVNDQVGDVVRQEMLDLVEDIYLAHPIKDDKSRCRWIDAVRKLAGRAQEEWVRPEHWSDDAVERRSEWVTEKFAEYDALDEDDIEGKNRLAYSLIDMSVPRTQSNDQESELAAVQWLRDLLNLYDKVRAEEGCITDDYEWDETVEMDLIEFTEEYGGSTKEALV